MDTQMTCIWMFINLCSLLVILNTILIQNFNVFGENQQFILWNRAKQRQTFQVIWWKYKFQYDVYRNAHKYMFFRSIIDQFEEIRTTFNLPRRPFLSGFELSLGLLFLHSCRPESDRLMEQTYPRPQRPILLLLSSLICPCFYFSRVVWLNAPPSSEELHVYTIVMGLTGILVLLARLPLLFVLAVYFYILEILAFFTTKKKDVRNEIVLITGAGHGIGREVALEFGRLGARVVIWDINQVIPVSSTLLQKYVSSSQNVVKLVILLTPFRYIHVHFGYMDYYLLFLSTYIDTVRDNSLFEVFIYQRLLHV